MWSSLRAWLFPVSCIACGRGSLALCVGCSPGAGEAQCFTVAGIPARAAGSYAGPLREAIVALKRGERDQLDALAPLLAHELAGTGAALVPVPTSGARRRARGFDQGRELARRAAALSGLALADVLVKRGLAQQGLRRSERLDARARFGLRCGAVLPAAAILVDDVCTTGATLRDAVLTLRSAGVEVRSIAVLARTPDARTRPARGNRALRSRVVPSVKAIWNGTVLAQSDHTEVVEGNHYFPPDAIVGEHFKPSATHSVCPWKGTASYYTIEAGGKQNPDAAWYYPEPKDAAKQIKGYVAFWKGVQVV